VHRSRQLGAQPGKLRRSPAQLRLEPAHLGRELAVLVDAGAEQLLQLLGSGGRGERSSTNGRCMPIAAISTDILPPLSTTVTTLRCADA
jgi:hypothetical protein